MCVFPDFIVQSLKNGLPLLDKKIKGFAKPSSVITAPETRSSAPVRILRDENMQSVSIKGLYPCGEGAGYAGGIMSAALDGYHVARAIMKRFAKLK